MKFNEDWKNQRIAMDFTLLDICRSSAYEGATDDNYTWFLSSPHYYFNTRFALLQLVQLLPDGMTPDCIKITSGIRCPKVNEAVGGTKTSYHMHGLALDIISMAGPDVLKKIWKNAQENEDVSFYEVIWCRSKGLMHLAASYGNNIETAFIIRK